MAYRLGDLAEQVGAELRGDADCEVVRVSQLQNALPGAISFLANSRYLKHLADTRASAVIISPELAQESPVAVLVSDNPYLCYARVADILHPTALFRAGIHPTSVIAEDANIADDVCIGPCSVI